MAGKHRSSTPGTQKREPEGRDRPFYETPGGLVHPVSGYGDGILSNPPKPGLRGSPKEPGTAGLPSGGDARGNGIVDSFFIKKERD